MIRSILSILAGIVVWGILWVAANSAIAAMFPSRFDEDFITRDPLVLSIIIAVSVVLSVLAGYVCARIARRRMMTHVTILALIQLGIGIAVQAGVGDRMPLWYHVIFLATVVPAHLLGGWMRSSARIDSPRHPALAI